MFLPGLIEASEVQAAMGKLGIKMDATEAAKLTKKSVPSVINPSPYSNFMSLI